MMVNSYKRECYKLAKEKTEKLLHVLEEAMSGKSLPKACAEENLQLQWVRRYIEKDISAGCNLPDIAVITQEDCEDWDDKLWGDIIGDHSLGAPSGFADMLELIATECMTDQEQMAMYMRYCDDMTFQGIADELGVSKARIEAVVSKVLRKLRNPERRLRLQYGEEYEEALKQVGTAQAEYDRKYLKEIRKREQETEKVLTLLNEKAESLKKERDSLENLAEEDLGKITGDHLYTTKLEELGLSVRSCNAFYRHFKRMDVTAADVAELSGRLRYIRGLGTKCCAEVADVMRDRFGIEMLYSQRVG